MIQYLQWGLEGAFRPKFFTRIKDRDSEEKEDLCPCISRIILMMILIIVVIFRLFTRHVQVGVVTPPRSRDLYKILYQEVSAD